MAQVKFTAYGAPDTAVESADLSALPSGTAAANYKLGGVIDNTSQRTLYGDLEIVLSATVTTGSGSPYMAVYLIPSMDGVTYATTGGSNVAGPAATGLLAGIITAVASTAVQVLHLRGIVLPPSSFKIMLQNVLGVALPASTTSTARLYRYSEEA